MMTLKIGEYASPRNLSEAYDLLGRRPWRIGCGCTDIFPQLRDGKWPSIDLLDLRYIAPEFSYVRIDNGTLCIGAMSTHDFLSNDPIIREYLPMLSWACGQVGSAQVRKRATIGGNILNASPAADSVPTLMACDASLVLSSASGERVVRLNGFASRPGRTDIQPDEILTEIRVPVGNSPWTGKYLKAGPRNALTISVADAAVIYHPDAGYRIACGSVAATVVRACETERLFNDGKPHTKQEIRTSMAMDIHPIDDVRSGGEYRMNVLVNLIDNFFQYERQV